MRINCSGPRHEHEGADWYCPLGNILDEAETWERCCADCRDELDRWDELYAQARRDTIISDDLKDRE